MLESLMRVANRGRPAVAPFDPTTSIAPPGGPRSSWVHYGVMVPDLPEPHRTFGVMSILGTPGVDVFANDHAITTTPADTAYLVSATGALRSDTFHTYSIARDCELAPDGGLVRLGDDLLIEGMYPRFDLTRRHPDGDVRLAITATDKVSHFADLRGGVYSHWSLLCEYEGTVGQTPVSGLCTFEYAHGVGMRPFKSLPLPNLPLRFFTYHVLNVDPSTQVLFAEAHGPRGMRLLRSVYVRGLDEHSVACPDADFTVETWGPTPWPTPRGVDMRLPEELTLSARDPDGRPLIEIQGRANGDWAYGLGAGFAGSYRYGGTFRGRSVSGDGYLEYVAL